MEKKKNEDVSTVKRSLLAYRVYVLYGDSSLRSYSFLIPTPALESFIRKVTEYANTTSGGSIFRLFFRVELTYVTPQQLDDVTLTNLVKSASKFVDYSISYLACEGELPF